MQSIQCGILLSFLSFPTNWRAQTDSPIEIPRDETARTEALSIKGARFTARLVAELTMEGSIDFARVRCCKQKRNSGTSGLTVTPDPNLPISRRISQGGAA
jgi:hypothetical protein